MPLRHRLTIILVTPDPRVSVVVVVRISITPRLRSFWLTNMLGGVFLQGTNGQSSGSCSYAGSVLQTSYNDIRNDGCVACGSEIFDNGCEVTINYVTSC